MLDMSKCAAQLGLTPRCSIAVWQRPAQALALSSAPESLYSRLSTSAATMSNGFSSKALRSSFRMRFLPHADPRSNPYYVSRRWYGRDVAMELVFVDPCGQHAPL